MADDSDALLLYPFKFFDPIRKRWVKSRYVAELEDIKARYERFEITGEPERRPKCDPDHSPYDPK